MKNRFMEHRIRSKRRGNVDRLEYTEPSIEQIVINVQDVIRTSLPDIDGGEGWI